MKDWAYVVVAIKLKWLHQKLGEYHAAGKEKRRGFASSKVNFLKDHLFLFLQRLYEIY